MKSPCFQFYPKEFLAGTVSMSCEEAGAYIRLLCYQWENEFLPKDAKKLQRITGAKNSVINEVLNKFELTDKGYTNARLERSRKDYESYLERQKINGLKGGRPPINNKPKENPVVLSGLTQTEPTQNPTVLNLETQNQTQTEPKENPSSSSSISSNMCVIAREATCYFFKVSEIKNFRTYKVVSEAIAQIEQNGQIEYYQKQLEGYKNFKKETGQQICNVITWLFGEVTTAPNLEAGHWTREDYSEKFKELQNGKNTANYSKNTAATAAIESGKVKDFGKVEL